MALLKAPSLEELRYRRGQVEYALWRIMSLPTRGVTPTPPPFRTRIKKLLDIDRGEQLTGALPGAAPFAFADEATEGSGTEAEFLPFDVFCLALALHLGGVGFKQSEIVFLLRHIRKDLRRAFARIVATYPPDSRTSPSATGEYASLPSLPNGRVDCDVYFLTSKVELTEQLPAHVSRSTPVIAPPLVCYGREAFAEDAADFTTKHQTAVVVEIGRMARATPALLASAPRTQRGRKS